METNHLLDLQLDAESNSYLSETAKWAKFISIAGFVICGILAIVGIFMASLMGNMPGIGIGEGLAPFITTLFLLIVALYFFPCFYLFRFAKNMKMGLQAGDSFQLQESFKNLKSCFKFIGILTIIILVTYGLTLIGGVAAAAIKF